MLSKIISITTGTNLDEYLDKRIFQPLSIPKPKWDKCPKGKELIPLSYIEKATSVQIKTSDFNPFFATEDHHRGYGYQIWMNSYPNSFRMDGLYDQYVVMLPDRNAMVTYISNEPENMTGVLELTWNTLIDKL